MHGDVRRHRSGGSDRASEDLRAATLVLVADAREAVARARELLVVNRKLAAQTRVRWEISAQLLHLSPTVALPEGEFWLDGVVRWTMREVPPENDRVAVVRRQVVQVLKLWGLDQLVWKVELVVSELVTNAIRHARTPFTVSLEWDGCRLQGDVIDIGPGTPSIDRAPDTSQTGGRGLYLVDELVDRWEWQPAAGGGKSVAFYLDET